MSIAADLHGYSAALVDFVREHHTWAAPVVAVLAFGESLAFISLLVPASMMLVAMGVLIHETRMSFWPILFAGAIGAALGDWLSYWIGFKVGPRIADVWPLSRTPGLLPRGEELVRRWGTLGIFIGRFFGPLRAVVPLVAGIFAMPFWRFQVANFVSAFAWVAVVLTFGNVIAMLLQWLKRLW